MHSEFFTEEAGEGPVRDLALHGLKRGRRRLGREHRKGMESQGRLLKEGMGLMALGLVLTPVSPGELSEKALASWLRKPES